MKPCHTITNKLSRIILFLGLIALIASIPLLITTRSPALIFASVDDYPGQIDPPKDPTADAATLALAEEFANEVVVHSDYICPNVPCGQNLWGVHYTNVGCSGGFCVLVPDPTGEKEKWGGAHTLPPSIPNVPTPPSPPPPSLSGVITATAVVSDIAHLKSCDQLQLVKTCLASPETAGCDAIPTKQYLTGTKFYLNTVYGPLTQTAEGVRFSNVTAYWTWEVGAYNTSGLYSPYLTCYNTTSNPTYLLGVSVYLLPNMTADFIVGYGPILPWFQVTGGGNTFGKTIVSLMPLAVSPSLLFDKTTAPTSPGIVSSSEGVDFADLQMSNILQNISSTNWNTDNGMTSKDWYTFFKTRLLQGTVVPYEETGGKPTRVPGAKYTVYTTNDRPNKDLTINEPWVVADGEKIIIVVEGSLDIYAKINITGNGFVGFVVKDDIIVDKTVGTTWDGTIPLVEGVYIAGNRIKTGHSTDAATERFVGKGIFMAKDIVLQRDLSTTAHNINTSADLFLYNPAFLVTAPDILKDLSYEWQEVAP